MQDTGADENAPGLWSGRLSGRRSGQCQACRECLSDKNQQDPDNTMREVYDIEPRRGRERGVHRKVEPRAPTKPSTRKQLGSTIHTYTDMRTERKKETGKAKLTNVVAVPLICKGREEGGRGEGGSSTNDRKKMMTGQNSISAEPVGFDTLQLKKQDVIEP